MKKLLPGLAAILLAAMFSAFNEKQTAPERTLPNLGFWYKTDGTTVGDPVYENGALPINKSNSTVVMASACPDNSGSACVIGYESQLTEGHDIPGDVERDAQVLRN